MQQVDSEGVSREKTRNRPLFVEVRAVHGDQQAAQLAALARECGAFVNLIPLHPGGAGNFTPTSPQRIQAFARDLRQRGVEVAIRKSRGMDIAAACGQLRVERQRRRPPISADQDGNVQVA